MKNRIPQIAMILVLCIILAISLPASYAKYTDKKVYTVNLVKNINFPKISFVSSSAYNNYPSAEYPIKKSGYYAIVAKGGSGSTGMRVKRGAFSEYVLDYFAGGSGGIVAGYVYLEKGNTVHIAAGSTGKRADFYAGGGAGGKNAFGFGSGGTGSDVTALGSGATSGGGGAASLVMLNNKAVSNINNFLVIAAGGGSAGSNDVGYAGSSEAGAGGAGGRNYNVSTGEASAPGIYNGSNGVCSSGKDYYGHGGTTVGGKADGNHGKDFSNGGTGGSAPNASSAGAGGGGYAGGGGGRGTSRALAIPASGGGGGSSYMSSSMTAITKPLFEYAISQTNGACSTSQLGGFAIIVYLGDSPTVPTT